MTSRPNETQLRHDLGPSIEHAVVRPSCVCPVIDDVDFVVHCLDDRRRCGSRDAVPHCVDGRRVSGFDVATALVQEDDDRLDSLLLQLAARARSPCPPRRVKFSVRYPGATRSRASVSLERHPDDGDLHASGTSWIANGGKMRLARVLVGDVRREEFEVCAEERVAGPGSRPRDDSHRPAYGATRRRPRRTRGCRRRCSRDPSALNASIGGLVVEQRRDEGRSLR